MKKLFLVLAVLAAGCTKERIVYRDSPTAPASVAVATPPPSYRFPQDIPDKDISVVPGVSTLYDVVNQETAAMIPDCRVGVRCDSHGYSAQSFFNVLNTRLRARGLWAGQHRDGVTDEITVAVSCAGPWENYHQWNYTGYPNWAVPNSTPCAGADKNGGCRGTSYRGNTVIPDGYCK
jgi:hypothetical protein